MKHNWTKIRKRKKIAVVEAFGDKCSICGYNKYSGALCFHHINPKLKLDLVPSTIITQLSVTNAIERLIKEKCILVCANCHAELHEEKYDYRKVEKSIIIPKKKNCVTCGDNFFTKDDTQKYCSTTCSSYGMRKIERPSKDDLKRLVKELGYSQTGRMFGVSDNAIRKWIK